MSAVLLTEPNPTIVAEIPETVPVKVGEAILAIAADSRASGRVPEINKLASVVAGPVGPVAPVGPVGPVEPVAPDVPVGP